MRLQNYCFIFGKSWFTHLDSSQNKMMTSLVFKLLFLFLSNYGFHYPIEFLWHKLHMFVPFIFLWYISEAAFFFSYALPCQNGHVQLVIMFYVVAVIRGIAKTKFPRGQIGPELEFIS